MSLLEYEAKFSELNPNRRHGNTSPHKIAMLLAVMDLIESGSLQENRIYFDRQLKDAFTKRFNELKSEADRDNPHLPYYHLHTSGFWHHQVNPGQRESYKTMSASGASAIDQHIAYAYLDEELFELLQNFTVRKLLTSALDRNFAITETSRKSILGSNNHWNWLECEAIVQDYFVMLDKEFKREPYSKADHRRALLTKLNNRSEGSIEYKHQNISAVLVELNLPYISGYKPASNYQKDLKQAVLAHLAKTETSSKPITQYADSSPISTFEEINWKSVLDTEAPARVNSTNDQFGRPYLATKPNYAQREARNRQLGKIGEAFVIEYEKFRLTEAGRPDLAMKVEWTSKAEGDGLGYDIRSFDPYLDEPLFLEVKATNSGKYQPFYITDRELDFSREHAAQYKLYRVYEMKSHPRLFILRGAVDDHVHLRPRSFEARFS